MSRFFGEAEQPEQASRAIQDATRWPPRRWEQKELMQALWLSKIEAQRDGLRRTGILPGPQSCSSTPTLDCSCCLRALAASKRECCWSRVPAFAGARHLKGRRHLLPLVLRRQARWMRSTPGALLERPAPPCKPLSHPAPTPRTSSAALHRPRIVCTPRSRLTPRWARVRRNSIFCGARF